MGRRTYRDRIVIIRVLAEDGRKARSFFRRFREKTEVQQVVVENCMLGKLELSG